MKNTNHLIAWLLLATLSISCSKEKNEIILERNRTEFTIKTGNLDWCNKLSNGKELYQWICFDSKESYEEVIEIYSNSDSTGLQELQKILGFQSMALTFSEKECDSLGVNDAFFASLLSPEGVIQIENYILHMDFVDSTVQILCTTDSTVLERNTDFDFFSFLEGDENDSKTGRYRFNKETQKVWVEIDVDQDIPGLCVVSKLKYEPLVTYFCLKTVINKTYLPNWFGGNHFGDAYISGGPDIHIHVDRGTSNTGYYTTNKRNATRQYISGYDIGDDSHTVTKKVYSGARGLKEFQMSATFSWNVNNGGVYGSKSLAIRKTAQ